MKHRRNAAIFGILCILLYLLYAYWGLSEPLVLALSVISLIVALYNVVMMARRSEKSDTGQSTGASSDT